MADRMHVERVALADLRHDDRNPRTHDDRNLRAIMDSLEAHGQVEPLLVQASTRMVIAGNGRMAAMERLGWTEADAVLLAVDDQQARELSIRLNRTGDLAGWDEQVLAEHLRELAELADDWSPEGLGFTDDDLAGLDGWDPDPDPDPDPERPRVGGLVADWGAPPFTVLDSRAGYWRARRAWWLEQGLRPELGRVALAATVKPMGRGSYDYFRGRGGNAEQGGGSTFDPALAELLIGWFSAPGDVVLDPFAGGPVRGVVAAVLGRRYLGVDVRPEQVEANVGAWEQLRDSLPHLTTATDAEDHQPELTPVVREPELGVWVKRDDLYRVAGVCGGKVRTCWELAQGATGLVTAGSRASPQVNIVAHVARSLGVPCRVHTPSGEASPEVADAVAAGAERVVQTPGHNSVIRARAREDAAERGWTLIPFGMECEQAVELTRAQVRNLPAEVGRVVVPVGSGMSLAGILWGLRDLGLDVPVLGVVVGADPAKRLDTWGPPGWREQVELVPSGTDYHEPVEAVVGGVALDPHYEAKAAQHLREGDLLWVVGVRRTVAQPAPSTGPRTVTLSAAWASKRVDCTAEGITRAGGCGGGCCRSEGLWPPRAGEVEGACDHLGPTGCTLEPADRPATCLLFPLVSKGDRLDRWGRMLLPQSVCGPCTRRADAPMLVEAVLPGLRELVPDLDEQALVAAVRAGEDAQLTLPVHVVHALEAEHAMADEDRLPPPRRAYAPARTVELVEHVAPSWVLGDSRELPDLLPADEQADLVLTCPPYADLERYSDDPRDLSTMHPEDFRVALRDAVAAAGERLRPGGFLVVVIGEVRGDDGSLLGLVPWTWDAIRAAGCRPYNDAILINAAGSAPLRAGLHFRRPRKLSRVHQYVLVGVKGEPRADLPDPLLVDVSG